MKQKRSLLTISLVLTLWTCRREQSIESNLIDYLNQQEVEIAELDFVHVITENGCPGCNYTYYQFVKETLGKKGHLTILAAQGTHIDISDMLRVRDGVITVANQDHSNTLFDSSRVFVLEQGEIDSVITFEPTRIHQQVKQLNTLVISYK